MTVPGGPDRSTETFARSPGLESLWLVNPGREEVHGERAVRSVLDVPGDVDLACILVGADGAVDALKPVVERGIPAALIVASGYAEAGPEGESRSEELRSFALDHGLAIIGPNTSGMANVAGGVYAIANTLSPPFIAGPIGVVTQSGGVASQLLRLMRARGVGVRAVLGVGNELQLGVTDVIRHFVNDAGTTVIAAYIEGFRDIGAFRSVAAEAAQAGKPIVALKVGRTAASQALVASHTGALVGDDDIVDVAFRAYGIIRVDTLDALVATAGLLAHGPERVGERIAVIAGSGATCTLIADRIDGSGLQLPSFAPSTTAELARLLPPYATPRNPLDATGAVVNDDEASRRAVHAVAADPAVDLVVYQSLVPERFDESEAVTVGDRLAAVRQMIDGAAAPVLLQTDISTDLSDELMRALGEHGLYVSRGYDHTIDAVARAARWHRQQARNRIPADPPVRAADEERSDDVVWSESDSMALLAKYGVPTVPTVSVGSAADAVKAARSFGGPVVVKVAADGLAHKSDIGGVVLGLSGDDEVADAFEHVMRCGTQALGDGSEVRAAVSPMRGAGIELLVSVTDARPWGTLLTVGLGGVWVEVLDDTASALLPIDAPTICEMLQALGSSALLAGSRGRAPADLAAIADAVVRVVEAATSLGGALRAVEVNPLLVDGERVEALDALVITAGSDDACHDPKSGR